jgi:hypothetical protein
MSIRTHGSRNEILPMANTRIAEMARVTDIRLHYPRNTTTRAKFLSKAYKRATV